MEAVQPNVLVTVTVYVLELFTVTALVVLPLLQEKAVKLLPASNITWALHVSVVAEMMGSGKIASGTRMEAVPVQPTALVTVTEKVPGPEIAIFCPISPVFHS